MQCHAVRICEQALFKGTPSYLSYSRNMDAGYPQAARTNDLVPSFFGKLEHTVTLLTLSTQHDSF